MYLYHALSLLLALEEDEENPSSKRKYFRDGLNDEGRLRRRARIPRVALLDPTVSPWQYMYDSRDDTALITVTGFDRAIFDELLLKFIPYYNSYSPWDSGGAGGGGGIKPIDPLSVLGGRPRKLDAAACLALVLVANRTTGSLFQLQTFFGATGTPIGKWLQFGRRIVCLMLENDPLAAVRMPSVDKIEELKSVCNEKFMFLRDAYCVGDGLKIPIENCGDPAVQNQFYNGWTHGTYITNLFIFSLDGRLIAMIINAPGSMHDSTLAMVKDMSSIYDHLEQIYQLTGGRCVMDSAFASANTDSIIKSAQDCFQGETALEISVFRDATSLRQAAEWGMRALQGSFPRLTEKIKWEDNEDNRFYFLYQVTLLYNYRLERVGLNQIRNTYVPAWSRDAAFFM